MESKNLTDLFNIEFGTTPHISPLKGGGSKRRYFRMSGGENPIVGVESEDIEENKVFIEMSRMLRKNGIRVPEVISMSDDKKYYLQEDLGDLSLYDLLSGEDRVVMGKRALQELLRIQTLPEKEWMGKVGHAPFSRRLISWDLNYFKYDFLKIAGITFDEDKLEDDFERLTEALSTSMVTGLMYRDFQSRNIMVKEGNLWFIDFQGARKGPLAYDAVSFIFQAKAPFTFEEREELIRFYANELHLITGESLEEINRQLELMEIFRCLQVLGAYGFRGLIEKKQHFIDSIPFAIKNLKYLRSKGILTSYPEIKLIADRIEIEKNPVEKQKEGVLTITVNSFSYKKGYPVDNSGNGGGFMFDCRGVHNPGRYERYKELTGRDKEVIEFLENIEESKEFLENSVRLVKPSIERYLKRGFTSLQVGFGCTGGQHRSVYFAENFAKRISELYPDVRLKVKHREQNIEYQLPDKKDQK